MASGLTVTSVTALSTLGNNEAHSDVPVSTPSFAIVFLCARCSDVRATQIDGQRERLPTRWRGGNDPRDLSVVTGQDKDGRPRPGQHRCRTAGADRPTRRPSSV